MVANKQRDPVERLKRARSPHTTSGRWPACPGREWTPRGFRLTVFGARGEPHSCSPVDAFEILGLPQDDGNGLFPPLTTGSGGYSWTPEQFQGWARGKLAGAKNKRRALEVIRYGCELHGDERQETFAEQGRLGGQSGKGKSKRPHTALIRHAVEALTGRGMEVSAANVRLLLKTRWDKLALEWGDPLRDIVDVQVREQGPVVIEYTAKWAVDHRTDRFVRLDSDALKKQIERAAG